MVLFDNKKFIAVLTVAIIAFTTAYVNTSAVSAKETSQQTNYYNNEIIVVFNDDVDETVAEEITEGNVEVLDTEAQAETVIEDGTPVLVSYDENIDMETAIEELEENDDVAFAQPNFIYTPDGVGAKAVVNDKQAGKLWYFDYMDVPEAWNLIEKIKEIAGPKDRVIISAVDTGCVTNNKDMQANLDTVHSVNVTGDEPRYTRAKWNHGTKVTSILCATANNKLGISGIASGRNNDLVSVYAVNVYKDYKYTRQEVATTADVIKGIEYSIENGAQLINLSFSYYDKDMDVDGNPHDDMALEKEIDKAVYEYDIPVICSAGNHHNDIARYPTDFESTIGVVGIKRHKNAWANVKTHNSNYGPAKTIGGAGENIYRYVSASAKATSSTSTSVATPTVTSVAALMLYVNPDLSQQEVRDILCSTATDVYLEGKDDYTGYGLTNAFNAVKASAYKAVEDGTLGMSKEELDEVVELTKPAEEAGQTLNMPLVTSAKTGKKAITIRWGYKCPYTNRLEIHRATEPDGEYQCVKTFSKKATSWQDKATVKGQEYFYKVRVFGTSSDGKKVWSDYSLPKSVIR